MNYRNSVGAGDAMLAGMAHAILAGHAFPEILKWGVAAGAAAVESWEPGGIRRGRVVELVSNVRVSPV